MSTWTSMMMMLIYYLQNYLYLRETTRALVVTIKYLFPVEMYTVWDSWKHLQRLSWHGRPLDTCGQLHSFNLPTDSDSFCDTCCFEFNTRNAQYYLCTTCDNYTLCQKCQRQNMHRKHTLVAKHKDMLMYFHIYNCNKSW